MDSGNAIEINDAIFCCVLTGMAIFTRTIAVTPNRRIPDDFSELIFGDFRG